MADKSKAAASKALKNLDGKMAALFSFFFIIKEVAVGGKKEGRNDGLGENKREEDHLRQLCQNQYILLPIPSQD